MRLLILLPLFLLGCTDVGQETSQNAASGPLISETGSLEHKKLDEASGLATSLRAADLFWSINDDGPAVIYALNPAGQHLGKVDIVGANNRDWEDLASFSLDGVAYLAIADIGDNDSKHKHLSLYVVEEPDPEQDAVELAWQIDFVYPGGPRDAESMAVDPEAGVIYVLSKRTVPAELYELPLRPIDSGEVTAKPVGKIKKLPQPTPQQLRRAAENGWGWQPTAMDIAPDGSSVLILTYDGVNYFARADGQSVPAALKGRAMHLSLGSYENAESIAYTQDSQAAVVTFEGRHSPVIRVELDMQPRTTTNSPGAAP